MEAASVIFIAFLIDALIGDPRYAWHPVRLIGWTITYNLRLFKKAGLKGISGGVILAFLVILATVFVYWSTHYVLSVIYPLLCLPFNVYVCYSCLALKDLFHHLIPVVEVLESNDMERAGMALNRVVGRDALSLDRQGMTRAAIETLSENFVDGFFSPLFWHVAGSVAGTFSGIDPVFAGTLLMVIFKAVSTLDSMVGYRNEEFSEIGWAGARLDDAMNYIPARLSLLILFLGSLPGRFHPIDGLRVAFRDRLKHDSPNSAHAESFIAGALNIRLGGPVKYPEGIKERPWLGREYDDPDIRHIKIGMGLIRVSSWVSIIIYAMILIFNQNIVF